MTGAPARSIGLWTAVALVMGNMIGAGVFLLPASLAPFGGIALIGWVVSAGGSLLLARVFAWLAEVHPASGGPYAYTRRAFGDLAGFLVAWGYWLSVVASNAAVAVAFVGYLESLVPGVKGSPIREAGLAIAAMWFVTLVNIRGVRGAGRLQVVTTALKIVPLVVIGVAGLFVLTPSHFDIPAAASTPAAFGQSLLSVVTLTLWAFLGLECATIPAGEVKDPARTIPRATIIGTSLAAVIYMVSTAGVMGVLPPETLGATAAPFGDAARALFGRAGVLVAVGATISAFGALNGWVLVSGQLPRAVADDGLFPAIFARTGRAGTPIYGLLISTTLTTILIATNYTRGLVALFTFILFLATLATLIPYVFCTMAWWLDARAQGRPRRGRTTVALLAFVYAMGAIAGAGAEAVFWGFLLLLAGLPVYVLLKRVPAP